MKTTVYLDEQAYRRLKALAAREGRSAAELIRLAVSEYADRHGPTALPASVGLGDSGGAGRLSECAEDLLSGWDAGPS